MTQERRTATSAGLRTFFQEQWDFLTGLAEKISPANNSATQVSPEDIEAVVSGTNARIRIVGNYKKRLRKSVRALIDYVDLLAAVFPEPINASPENFSTDEHLNAFFISKKHLQETFGDSKLLREFFEGNMGLDAAYAILLMHKREKKVLGTGQVGDMMVGDVTKTTIGFTNHHLERTAGSKDAINNELKRLLFDHYLTNIKRHMSAKQGSEDSNDPNSLANPERYLNELSRVMEKPHDLLELKITGLHVDRLGFLVDGEVEGQKNELKLRELKFADNASEFVVLVEYPRSQMPEKKNLLQEAGRILGSH